MTTVLPGWTRAGARAAAPVLLAAGLLTAAASSAAASGVVAASSDADIRILGGHASSGVVCGNVASAEALARQRHVALQRSHCTATASGGSVTLNNVDIYVSQSARARNRGNTLLAALAVNRAGTATDACSEHQPPPAGSRQLNRCWAVAHGGRLVVRNVDYVDHRGDGTTISHSVASMVLSDGDGGAEAGCANIVSDPLSQRDDCAAVGRGAGWSLRDVDVDVHESDGSTSRRHGIDVEIRGGAATADIYCFNVTDGSGHVVQINVCNANANGGDATLRNVTIHSYS
jgi:hypothetical protein